MNSLPRVHGISTESAWKKAIGRSNLVFVHFATGGADPVTKYVNQLSKQPEYRRVTFVKFDMDKLGPLAAKVGVVVAPTFRVYRNNVLLEGFAGVIPQKMLSMLDTHNKSPEKKAGGIFRSKLTLLLVGTALTVGGLWIFSKKNKLASKAALGSAGSTGAAEGSTKGSTKGVSAQNAVEEDDSEEEEEEDDDEDEDGEEEEEEDS
eukprot:CAMPEP_0198211388 /NCGR_PEP_ID=MMETSP1445-20131203/23568_1 /TAXON_ID=36898 /ORGANISM="Pyramimonas sp., Strain CCMP2087" /LENGTH=204 /DNA_ID=CAMNT_0043885637 /DNA_START=161 /DNA_END=775 /DNA_ORIENTATION=+